MKIGSPVFLLERCSSSPQSVTPLPLTSSPGFYFCSPISCCYLSFAFTFFSHFSCFFLSPGFCFRSPIFLQLSPYFSFVIFGFQGLSVNLSFWFIWDSWDCHCLYLNYFFLFFFLFFCLFLIFFYQQLNPPLFFFSF